MEGYESPITQIIDKVVQESVMQDEANLMFTVRQTIGYAVDKEELIKALQYDRRQYEKGYEDGRKSVGKCSECKHFEYNSVAMVDGIPLIVAHEICKKWGDGCKTKEDGYCFMFEKKEQE